MEFISVTVLLLVLAISCLLFVHRRMLNEKRHLPPGPMPLPLVGNLLQLNLHDIGKSLMALHKKYGPLYTIFLGTQPCVVICGYDAMKEALLDQAEEFGGRGYYPGFYNYTKGHDIAFSNGEKWKDLRRFALLTLRNFGMGKRSVEERIQEEADYLVKELKKTNMAPIDPLVFFSRTVSNIICSIMFGTRYDYTDKKLLTIVNGINGNFRIMSSIWGTLYNTYPDFMDYFPGQHKCLFTNFDQIAEVILEELKSHLETHDPQCPRDYMDCFISKMEEEKIKPSTSFYDQTLIMTIQTLLFGGTETVSTTLRYGFLILMKYPKIAEKIQQEIDSVVGPNRNPTSDDRSKMPYTDAVINEIQRFADVIPLSLGHLVMKNTTLRGYEIPKGTYVIPLLTSVHYDASQFKNPQAFDPGNFLDENNCFQKRDALMPFCIGKRMCLGESLARMELFLYFTILLQNFIFKPLVSPEEIDLTPVGTGLGTVPASYKCRIVPR